MNLSDQVCSLELNKKLKELGVKQESLFYYYCHINPVTIEENYYLLYKYNGLRVRDDLTISAFTASELLELLPYVINKNYINISKHAEYVIYYGINPHNSKLYFEDFNLSNACAKMLIYLIENKLLEIK